MAACTVRKSPRPCWSMTASQRTRCFAISGSLTRMESQTMSQLRRAPSGVECVLSWMPCGLAGQTPGSIHMK